MFIKLSFDVLHRGTFLTDRDTQFSSFRSITNLDNLKETHKKNDRLRIRLQKLESSARSTSSLLLNGVTPTWAKFLDRLVYKKWSVDDFKLRLFHKLNTHNTNIAYHSPFFIATLNFLNELIDVTKTHISINFRSEVYYSIANWYIERMVETSRFVLHLKYKESGVSYKRWCEQFDTNDYKVNLWVDIVTEYPVLLHLLYILDTNCRQTIVDIFNSRTIDAGDISLEFGINKEDNVKKITLGLSDPHKGGRTVAKLEFDNGKSLIYKPKPLNIDLALYTFIKNSPHDFGIVPLKVISKIEYGWLEDIGDISFASRNFDNPNSIGNVSAFLWLLNSTDFHSENIVPRIEGIYTLDLETLFLPPVELEDEIRACSTWRNHSIYTTLLFDFSFGDNVRQSLSGFNYSPNVNSLGPQILFEVKDDDVVVTKKNAKKIKSLSGNKSTTKISSSIRKILNGFCEAVLPENIALIESFIYSLENIIPTRIVFRDTYFYSRIHDRMRQPRFLRDAVLMELDLFSLHIGASLSEYDSKFEQLIDDEIKQLINGDIPYFSTQVGSKSLECSTSVIQNFFRCSGKQHSLQKVNEVETSDIDEQTSLIRVALGHKAFNTGDNTLTNNSVSCSDTEGESLIISMQQLAQSIVLEAFTPSNMPSRWISMFGDVAGHESKVHIGESGFFSGSFGIITALEAANSVFLSNDNFDVVDAFLQKESLNWHKFLGQKKVNIESRHSALGFAGIGGEIFSFALLLKMNKVRWGFLLPILRDKLKSSLELIQYDTKIDVIGGCAGLIIGCEQLFCLEGELELKQIATKVQEECALHLVNNTHEDDHGLTWKIEGEEYPLLGYAHGWSGCVVALSIVLNRSSGLNIKARIKNCIANAVKFPQSLLVEYGKLRDYREGLTGEENLNRSWCHGLPGILRAFDEVSSLLDDTVKSEAVKLLKRIKSELNCSRTTRFCCGEMGNIDYLIDLYRGSSCGESTATTDALKYVVKDILNFAHQEQEEFIPELAFPSLFHGKSGMLYTASRIFNNELPSLSGQI